MPSLVLLKTPDGVVPPKYTPLNADRMVIGRDEAGCLIIIPHHAVSRQHAVITRIGEQYFIEDLKSRNKTFVNSVEITARQLLKPDDRIKICDFLFRFHDERAVKAKELPPHMRKDQSGAPERLTDVVYATAGGIIAGAQPVPDYLAPEQINERPDNPPSPATDLHAVGVILFQMLTGELPYPPGQNEWNKLETIVKRRFASCEERCRAKSYTSRLAPLIDRCLRGGEYRQARFLLRDLLGPYAKPPVQSPTPMPLPDEPFVVESFLFEDRWSEAFAATGAESGAPVVLRLVKPKYGSGELGALIRGLAPTPDDVPAGFLRRYRVGRGHPLPVRAGTRFTVGSVPGGCLVVVEEAAGGRTLLAAIEKSEFAGNDEAVLRVAVPLLEALDSVHARGAIHARLTPYCIFLPEAGGVKIEGFGRLPDPVPPPGTPPTVGVHADVDAIRLNQGGDADDGMTITTLNPIHREEPTRVKHTEVPYPTPASAVLTELRTLAVLGECQDAATVYRTTFDVCRALFPFAESAHVLRVSTAGYVETVDAQVRGGTPPEGEWPLDRSLAVRAAGGTEPVANDDESHPAICARLEDGEPKTVIQLRTLTRGKPFGPDHLQLLEAVCGLAALALAKVRWHEAAMVSERQAEMHAREFALARRVLLDMLPQAPPDVPGYEFYSHNSPAQLIGGDYYDFVPLPGGRVAVVVGEAAGRAGAAMLLVARLTAEVWRVLETDPDLARAVATLNDRLTRVIGDRFITLVIAVLDPTAHAVTLVSAGHMAPKLVRAATGETSDAITLDATGLPLGVLAGYPFEQVTFAMEPGDAVVMFTDGLTDEMNPAGEMFGSDAVDGAIARGAATGAKRIGERLIAAIRTHAAGRTQNDDITVVCFGRTEDRA